MSIHNIYFRRDIRKKYQYFSVDKSALSGAIKATPATTEVTPWQPLSTSEAQSLLATVFTPSIGTPYLLTILVLKFEIVHSTTCCCI